MVPVPPSLVNNSITWLLVTTSPLGLMIIPVPSSSLPCDLTSMDTTAGITFLTNWGMVTLPLSTAAPGSPLPSWIVTVPLPFELSANAVTPAPTPAPMRAATTAMPTHWRRRVGADESCRRGRKRRWRRRWWIEGGEGSFGGGGVTVAVPGSIGSRAIGSADHWRVAARLVGRVGPAGAGPTLGASGWRQARWLF